MEPGVEIEVNCHTRVNLVISSGMERGFFTTIPTATGSVGGEAQEEKFTYHNNQSETFKYFRT